MIHKTKQNRNRNRDCKKARTEKIHNRIYRETIPETEEAGTELVGNAKHGREKEAQGRRQRRRTECELRRKNRGAGWPNGRTPGECMNVSACMTARMHEIEASEAKRPCREGRSTENENEKRVKLQGREPSRQASHVEAMTIKTNATASAPPAARPPTSTVAAAAASLRFTT